MTLIVNVDVGQIATALVLLELMRWRKARAVRAPGLLQLSATKKLL